MDVTREKRKVAQTSKDKVAHRLPDGLARLLV